MMSTKANERLKYTLNMCRLGRCAPIFFFIFFPPIEWCKRSACFPPYMLCVIRAVASGAPIIPDEQSHSRRQEGMQYNGGKDKSSTSCFFRLSVATRKNIFPLSVGFNTNGQLTRIWVHMYWALMRCQAAACLASRFHTQSDRQVWRCGHCDV